MSGLRCGGLPVAGLLDGGAGHPARNERAPLRRAPPYEVHPGEVGVSSRSK